MSNDPDPETLFLSSILFCILFLTLLRYSFLNADSCLLSPFWSSYNIFLLIYSGSGACIGNSLSALGLLKTTSLAATSLNLFRFVFFFSGIRISLIDRPTWISLYLVSNLANMCLKIFIPRIILRLLHYLLYQ